MVWELILVLSAVGILFQFLGTVALHRFIDPYTRLHGSTKCTTFGSIFIALAVVIYAYSFGGGSMALHALIALLFLLLTNHSGAHAIARASHKYGVKPKQAVIDALEEEK